MTDDLVQNYKILLYAIFNTYEDLEQGREQPICVYDTCNNDVLVAIFKNAITCAKYFNATQRSINSSVCRGNLRKARYRLERIRYDE